MVIIDTTQVASSKTVKWPDDMNTHLRNSSPMLIEANQILSARLSGQRHVGSRPFQELLCCPSKIVWTPVETKEETC